MKFVIIIYLFATTQPSSLLGSENGTTKGFQEYADENGTNLCCEWVGQPTDPNVAPILQQHGITDPEPLAAKTCKILMPYSNCNQDQSNVTENVQETAIAVCCQDNSFNGVIAIGCEAINIPTQ